MVHTLTEFYKRHRIPSGVDIFDKNYLESLFVTDTKKLQFIVFYFYLTKAELPKELSDSTVITFMITTLVTSLEDVSVTEYYSKYFNLSEVTQQWSKMYSEIKTFEDKRQEYLRLKNSE